MSTPGNVGPAIGARNWLVMAALALTGQIAWAVENSWFNTFVYDTITRSPQAVAWMVAASAITATLTTLLMGALSDRSRHRWGRRPFILVGYILWGLATVLFPTVSYVQSASLAVILVVLADSIMTFFGSTANDAAFNAWTADVASASTRGKVEGVLNLSLFLAQLVSLAAAGAFIESYGYFVFFYSLGGIVLVIGFVAGYFLRDAPFEKAMAPTKGYWAEIAELANPAVVRQNARLFVLLIYIMIASMGFQIAFPYLIIYLEHFLGYTKSEIGVIGGAIIIGSAALALPFGVLADRWNKQAMLAAVTALSAVGCLAFSFGRSVIALAISGLIWQAFYAAANIAAVALLKELLPPDQRGKFLGVRMVFWIAIPMVLGPSIGSSLIELYGTPSSFRGEAGYIPAPIIFQACAAVTLAALIPLYYLGIKTSPGERAR